MSRAPTSRRIGSSAAMASWGDRVLGMTPAELDNMMATGTLAGARRSRTWSGSTRVREMALYHAPPFQPDVPEPRPRAYGYRLVNAIDPGLGRLLHPPAACRATARTCGDWAKVCLDDRTDACAGRTLHAGLCAWQLEGHVFLSPEPRRQMLVFNVEGCGRARLFGLTPESPKELGL
jgi:hypothetical protein